jgi:hypothetical protein
MMAPAVAEDGRNLLVAKDLKAMGVHELSVNVELYNQEIARKVIPQKAALGWNHYVEFLKSAVKEYGWGNARTIFVFGIEPMEDTLKGIEAMAQIGVASEISPLIPDPSTPLVKVRNMTTPSASSLKEVYEKAYEISNKYGVLMGAKCVPCMHNVLDFPDMNGYRTVQYDRQEGRTIYTPATI